MWIESYQLPFPSSLNLDEFKNLEIILEAITVFLFYVLTLLATLPLEIYLIFRIP